MQAVRMQGTMNRGAELSVNADQTSLSDQNLQEYKNQSLN